VVDKNSLQTLGLPWNRSQGVKGSRVQVKAKKQGSRSPGFLRASEMLKNLKD
jgi:hypothetical protein